MKRKELFSKIREGVKVLFRSKIDSMDIKIDYVRLAQRKNVTYLETDQEVSFESKRNIKDE